jgi:hypothetical protein
MGVFILQKTRKGLLANRFFCRTMDYAGLVHRRQEKKLSFSQPVATA